MKGVVKEVDETANHISDGHLTSCCAVDVIHTSALFDIFVIIIIIAIAIIITRVDCVRRLVSVYTLMKSALVIAHRGTLLILQ